MATYKVIGPNKRVYHVEGPEGASKEEVLLILQDHLEQNPPNPQGGFGAAMQSGILGVQADMAGLGARLGLRDPAGAEEFIGNIEAKQGEIFAPTQEGWGQAPWQKFKETLGGSLPSMVAPIAGAGAAAVGGAPAAVGLGIAGLLSGVQHAGSNLSRQMDEGVPLQETNLGAAVGAAIPQAALDTLGMRMIPGVKQIFQAAGKDITDEAARQIAIQGTKQIVADYAKQGAIASGVEGATEAGQQFLERLQAGLNLTDEKARDEYWDALIGGAVLGGTLSVPGRAVERSQIKGQAAEADRREKAEEAQRAAAAAQEEERQQEEYRQTPAYLADVEQRWMAADQRRTELQEAVKAVPKGDEFSKEDRAAANKALSEYLQSDEFKGVRDEYRAVRPRIEQAKRQAQTMQGGAMQAQTLDTNRPIPFGQQDPLAGRAGEFPEAPKGSAVPVEEVAQRLLNDPAAAERVLSGEVKLGGLSPSEQRAVADIIRLHRKEQAKRQAQQEREQKAQVAQQSAQDYAQRGTELKELPPATTPVTEFMDDSDVDAANFDAEAPTQFRETVEQMLSGRLDNVADKALSGKPSAVQTKGVPAIGDRGELAKVRQNVDTMFGDLEKARSDYQTFERQRDREGMAEALSRLSEARRKIDAYRSTASPIRETKDAPDNVEGQKEQTEKFGAKDAPGYGQEVTRLRLDQQKALDDFETAVMEVQKGRFFGGSDVSSAASTKRGVLDQANKAKQAYIRAVLEEAATHREADGQRMTSDEAVKLASELNGKLNEAIQRVQEKPEGPRKKFTGRDYDKEEVHDDGSHTRWYTMFDPQYTNGPVNIVLRRDPDGNVRSLNARFVNGNSASMLRPDDNFTRHDSDETILDKRFPSFTFAWNKDNNATPLEDKPFGKPEAALATIREDVEGVAKRARVKSPEYLVRERPLLKQQFATTEAQKAAEARGETSPTLAGEIKRKAEDVGNKVEKALQRKDLSGGMRMSLNRAKKAMEGVKPTRDLLDAVDEMAERALRGERIRDVATLRDFNDALTAATRQEQPGQRELPGMEPTGFIRSTAQAFANSPRIKAAWDAIDGLKKLFSEKLQRQATEQRLEGLIAQINNQIELAKTRFPNSDFIKTAYPRLGLELKAYDLPPKEAFNRGGQSVSDEWYAAHKKAAEAYNQMLREARAARSKAQEATATEQNIKDEIAKLEKRRDRFVELLDEVKELDVVVEGAARDEAGTGRVKSLEAEIEDRRKRLIQTQGLVAQEYADAIKRRHAAILAPFVRKARADLKRAEAKVEAAKNDLLFNEEMLKYAKRSGGKGQQEHYEKNLVEQRKEVKALEDAASRLKTQLDDLAARSMVDVDLAAANEEASHSLRVLFEREALKYTEAKLAEAVDAKERAVRESAAGKQRTEVIKAEKAAEEQRQQAIQEKEAFQRRMINGLGLPGVKVIEGHKQTVLAAEQAEKLKAIREQQAQTQDTMATALRVAAGVTQEPVRRAAGPAQRFVKGGNKAITQPTATEEAVNQQDREISRKDMLEANEAAARLTKQDKATQLRAELANKQAEFETLAQREPTSDADRRTTMLRQSLLLDEMYDLDQQLTPLEEKEAADRAKAAEKNAKQERKKEQTKKQRRIKDALIAGETSSRQAAREAAATTGEQRIADRQAAVEELLDSIENDTDTTGDVVDPNAGEGNRFDFQRKQEKKDDITIEYDGEPWFIHDMERDDDIGFVLVELHLAINKQKGDLRKAPFEKRIREAIKKLRADYVKAGKIGAVRLKVLDSLDLNKFSVEVPPPPPVKFGRRQGWDPAPGWMRKHSQATPEDFLVESYDAEPDYDWPVNGMTFAEAARYGLHATGNPLKQKLFYKLAEIFDKAPEDQQGRVFGASDMGDVNGVFDSQDNQIFILTDGDNVNNTLLHELTHAATSRAMKLDKELFDAIEDMRLQVIEWTKSAEGRRYISRNTFELDYALSAEDIYALTNPFEFVAELFSHDGFQDLLTQIPSKQPKKSIFTRFVQSLAEFFFGKNNRISDSLFAEAVAKTEKIFDFTVNEIYGKNAWATGPQERVEKTDNRQGRFDFQRKSNSTLVGRPGGKWDNLKGNLFGMNFRVQVVDRFAAAERAFLEAQTEGKLKEWEAFQANYYMRFGEQLTQYAGQFITNGPVKIIREKVGDHFEERYGASEGANLKNVSMNIEKLAKQLGMTAEDAEDAATTMLAGERADAITNGWKRLNSKDPAKVRSEYNKIKAQIDGNAEAKATYKAIRDEYKEFSNGPIELARQTGFLSNEQAQRLKASPYVPFYRVKDGEVDLMVDSESPIRIGNIKSDPDLAKLVGSDEKILPLLTSAVQNTFMLTRMALQNKTKIVMGDSLKKAGFVSKMGAGTGPAGISTIRYRVDGKPYFAVIDADQFGIPAELMVKGMEGIATTLPAVVRMMGIPAQWIRQFVTRSPAYVFRQLVRDPVNAFIIGGVDGVPVMNALKQMAHMKAGRSQTELELMQGGTISSNVWTGGEEDMQKFLQRIAAGKTTWTKLMNWLDTTALQADAATRATVYEDSLKKGLSKAQAQFRALEYQNFSRRGLSPTMQMMGTMIPFFNAQVQGLDVIYRALTGKLPFAERLELKKKLITRSMGLMVTSLAYAMMAREDEDYMKIKPEQRYQNFFIRVPGMEDYLKIPIPYEIGIIFKAIPEAILDAALNDTKASEAATGVGKLLWQSTPGLMPVAIRPVLEAAVNKTYGFGPIETTRELQLPPDQRYRENSPEALKALSRVLGESTGLSPVMMEHFVRGYTSQLGVSVVRLLDPVMRRDDEGQKQTQSAATLPFIGGIFQRAEGRYLVDRAYSRWEEIVQAQRGYKDLVERGRQAEAREFAQRQADLLAAADLAGDFRQSMGDLYARERAIKQHPTMTQAQKDALLKKLKQAQNERAKRFFEASERTTPQ